MIRGLDIRSMHILFRPSQTPNFADRSIGFLEGQFPPSQIEELMSMTQSTKVVMYANAEEHDKEMAIQQALTHRVILSLAKMLKTCHGSTYISQKVIELSDRIASGNKELYGLIQSNEHIHGNLAQFKFEMDEFDVKDYFGDK